VGRSNSNYGVSELWGTGCDTMRHDVIFHCFTCLTALLSPFITCRPSWKNPIAFVPLRRGYTVQFSLQLVSQWRCDTSCRSVYTVQRWHKLEQSLPKVEANSTFGNDCCNLSRKKIELHGRLDGEMFRATCVATPLRDKLQRKLHRVIAPLGVEQ
jgi:hypothetical protein